ncbi:E3 ubiquitin-protein ligase RFWD3-like [Phymastichus coffea]|uniref:E3 ubiquitin-protein ligase RFWD3-like n=1 Tax=Phymastichus coffea TaxID=108790 RepID=UPI00273A7A18|nr:E3 ubiquitin-protein ligase RFWD3-like [Phymastichus coffea]XP_058795321.1 E3 ubiquitin-protein ligase RFWD3-like [Phymastichus coffea]
MSSPYNYALPSMVVSNVDNTDTESEVDGNEFLESNEFEYDSISEILPSTEMDTNSDLEDFSSEFLDISTTDENEVNDTESSTQLESDSETNDEETVVQEPELKRAKLNENEQFEDTESVDPNQKCPICLAAWTNIGEHRLCSLRCGHLFGYKCIKQWLTSSNPSAKKCPQCNSRASVRHICLIYGNKLSCVDVSQIEKMKKQLDESEEKLLKIAKALAKQKKKTKKYKQMYKARTLAVNIHSPFSQSYSDLDFSD